MISFSLSFEVSYILAGQGLAISPEAGTWPRASPVVYIATAFPQVEREQAIQRPISTTESPSTMVGLRCGRRRAAWPTWSTWSVAA